MGWATTKEAPLPEYTSGSVIDLSTDDVVLYAVWEANNYQIIYDANGGNGIMDSDSLAYDSTFTLSNNTYKKSGYTFKGWALDQNGEKMYNDCEIVSNLSSINGYNITLYAIWKKTVTQITFVTNDGTETNMPITIDYGTDLDTSDFNKPSRVGYIFSGYYTGMNGTGDLIIDANLNSTLSNGWELDVNSLTLYSHWTPITYSIVYMNGQTVCREQKVSYDSVFNLISFMQMGITVPTGYHFAGWSTVPSSKTIAYSDNQNITYALEKTEGSKVFLYAVFEVNQKYNIIYNANGGINAPIDSNTYFVGDIITIPTLEGYKFLGWSYDYENNPIDFPYENNAFTIPTLTMTEEGITLYAVWIEEKTLQNQINEVNVQIDLIQTSISDLNNTNSDFADKIDQLTIKMQNTQDVLDSLDSTYVTCAELNEAIAKLKSELLQADEALQNAINKVQANLDKAVTDLNETISNNKDDIESKLNAAVKAYEDSNVIINSKFASIAIKHEEFANLFDSLKEDLKTAEEKIWKEINDLQDDLKKLKEEMNKKDNELEEMIKSLTENTEKDKNYLDTISYINLGLIVTLAVAVIIIVLFFKRKMKNY
ncbi:MAG: InlB B-repeat-containing protein [Bacilli bacterium]|nr:InlB B-repeat-containing protein [Bacilli bacterium]